MKQTYLLANNGGQMFIETGDGNLEDYIENFHILDESCDTILSFENGEFFRHYYDEMKMLKRKESLNKDHIFEYDYEDYLLGAKLVPFKKRVVEKKRYKGQPEETITTTCFYEVKDFRPVLKMVRIKSKKSNQYESVREEIFNSCGERMVSSKEVFKDFRARKVTTTFTKYDCMGNAVDQSIGYRPIV